MRSADETPIDPQIAASLQAIDAAIAGQPVDPRHAELAELASLLTAQRPEMPAERARSLDQRLQRHFAPPARARRWWRFTPVGGAVAAAFAAAVAIVVVLSSGGPARLVQDSSGAAARPGHSAVRTPASAAAVATSKASPAGGAAALGPAGAASGSPVPGPAQPLSGGRKIIQAAQLALTTTPNRIDDVAQEVFDIVGRQNAVVNNSAVTATGGQDGSAQFQLSVPSSALSATMFALSRLRYAAVASRTDTTQDVSGQVAGAGHRLADARALRTSLLVQLSNATTQPQIGSLRAQIHDAEGAIARDEAALRGLSRQVAYSRLDVTVSAGAAPASGGGSFTIAQGVHDAGRVLTVLAGAALIGLAVLVPVGLVAVLVGWIVLTIRGRRREQALDAA